ncbi:MAG: 50S ribosomal protein L30 [SAR324 cluster bacterium]|jgi:large subunit ribosomal protein L30|nr:50S ribosomal protein L30 [Deltaproteobacteria bacterium]MDP6090342.1 50S ribosomal protein L30 [SAR324 cluster bacterium]MDP6248964.1 50S ribosomal protein L30 [SAR324 cluster bacterium]MDP7140496.1 50S ribosomal protein L30 [SAR324 cluster bacterium]MDP7498649.1 50S ribosomal protein L30 [SAR324 cluster bacterium]|tara:strand:+ start:163 stop:351 length:189 start_codon:yes stop_codon:yes gene_type:complete
MADKIKVTLVKSSIGNRKNQVENLKGLGLRKINSSKTLENTPSIRGMIRKVQHLVRIEILEN